MTDADLIARVLAELPPRMQAAQRRRCALFALGLSAGFAIALPQLDQWPNLAALSAQLTRTLTDLASNPSAYMGFGLAILSLVLTLRSGKNQES